MLRGADVARAADGGTIEKTLHFTGDSYGFGVGLKVTDISGKYTEAALRWTHEPQSVQAHECAVLWGARSADGLAPDVRRIRIEDGFFHSTGLGSDMIAPRVFRVGGKISF